MEETVKVSIVVGLAVIMSIIGTGIAGVLGAILGFLSVLFVFVLFVLFRRGE